jgi:hypothetical protein
VVPEKAGVDRRLPGNNPFAPVVLRRSAAIPGNAGTEAFLVSKGVEASRIQVSLTAGRCLDNIDIFLSSVVYGSRFVYTMKDTCSHVRNILIKKRVK